METGYRKFPGNLDHPRNLGYHNYLAKYLLGNLGHCSIRPIGIYGAFHELLRFYTGQNTDFGAKLLLNGTHFNKYFCNKQILTIFSIEIYIYNKY